MPYGKPLHYPENLPQVEFHHAGVFPGSTRNPCSGSLTRSRWIDSCHEAAMLPEASSQVTALCGPLRLSNGDSERFEIDRQYRT